MRERRLIKELLSLALLFLLLSLCLCNLPTPSSISNRSTHFEWIWNLILWFSSNWLCGRFKTRLRFWFTFPIRAKLCPPAVGLPLWIPFGLFPFLCNDSKVFLLLEAIGCWLEEKNCWFEAGLAIDGCCWGFKFGLDPVNALVGFVAFDERLLFVEIGLETCLGSRLPFGLGLEAGEAFNLSISTRSSANRKLRLLPFPLSSPLSPLLLLDFSYRHFITSFSHRNKQKAKKSTEKENTRTSPGLASLKHRTYSTRPKSNPTDSQRHSSFRLWSLIAVAGWEIDDRLRHDCILSSNLDARVWFKLEPTQKFNHEGSHFLDCKSVSDAVLEGWGGEEIRQGRTEMQNVNTKPVTFEISFTFWISSRGSTNQTFGPPRKE